MTISAETGLDQRQIQNREGITLARIVLSAALVLAICVVVALILQRHFSS